MSTQPTDPRIHHIPRVLRRVEQLGHYAAAVGKRVTAEAVHLRRAGYPLAFLELVPGTLLLAHETGIRVLQGSAEASESRALVAVLTPSVAEELPPLSRVRPCRGLPSGFRYGQSDCSGTWDNLLHFDYFAFLAGSLDFEFIKTELHSLVHSGVHALPERYCTRSAQVRELPAGCALAFRNDGYELVDARSATTSEALPVSEFECSSPAKLALFYRDVEHPWPITSKLPTNEEEATPIQSA